LITTVRTHVNGSGMGRAQGQGGSFKFPVGSFQFFGRESLPDRRLGPKDSSAGFCYDLGYGLLRLMLRPVRSDVVDGERCYGCYDLKHPWRGAKEPECRMTRLE
jgi:hypothetical protein